MFDKAESSSNSGVVANLSYIREKTARNADALKAFGISVDGKGRMKIDEDTFKKADMSKVQAFFKDYGSSIATNASLVDYYMTTQANAANSYTAGGSYNVQGGSAIAVRCKLDRKRHKYKDADRPEQYLRDLHPFSFVCG